MKVPFNLEITSNLSKRPQTEIGSELTFGRQFRSWKCQFHHHLYGTSKFTFECEFEVTV